MYERSALLRSDEHPPHLTHEQLEARMRLGRVLYRFTTPDDVVLSDDAMVSAVLARYRKARAQPLIDPAE